MLVGPPLGLHSRGIAGAADAMAICAGRRNVPQAFGQHRRRRATWRRKQASRRSTRAHAMRSAHEYSGAWASQPFIRHEFTTAAAVPAFRRSLKACCGRLTANAGQHTCWPAPACTAGPSTASREAHRPHAPPMPPLQRPCPAAGHGAHMRVRPRLRPQGLRAILQVFELSDTFGKCSSDTTPK